MKRTATLIALLVCFEMALGCARPKPEGEEKKNAPKAEYKDLKAEEYPIPDALKTALPGLVNDKIRIWKEISPTVNLVAYFPDYSLDKAIKQSADSFLVLLDNPAFATGIDFWIIQVQPEKGSEVMVWGVRPSEAEQYKNSKDLNGFFKDSEYVMVNDQIVEKGEGRLKFLTPAK